MSLAQLKLDCKTCSKNQKIERGCTEDSPIPGKLEIEGIEFLRCPLTVLNTEIYWYITAFNYWEKNIFPNKGGWNDQTNKFLEAMEFISQKRQKNGR